MKLLIYSSFSFFLLISIPLQARMVEGSGAASGKLQNFGKPSGNSKVVEKEQSLGAKWRKIKSKISYKVKVWLNRDKIAKKQQAVEQRIKEKQEKEKLEQERLAKLKVKREKSKNTLLMHFPSFKTKDKGSTPNEITKVNKEMKIQPTIAVKKLGRKADSRLPRAKSGVAYFKLKKKKFYKTKKGKKKYRYVNVNKIPKLDIGVEAEVEAMNWRIPEIDTFIAKFKKPKPLKSPELEAEKKFVKILGKKIKKAQAEKKMKLSTLKSLGIEKEKLLKLRPLIAQLGEITEKEIKNLKTEELKLLNALIHYEKENKCHIASGLYHELSFSKDREIKAISNLYLGICAHKMGLFTESVRRLLDVLRSDQDEFKTEAMIALLKEVPFEYEIDIGLVVKNEEMLKFVPKRYINDYYYTITKSEIRLKRFESAVFYAKKVSEKSKKYIKSQYVLAVSEYMQGKISASLNRQQKLKDLMDNSSQYDEKVYSLVAINLARVSFQKNRYKNAIDAYLKIDKKHPYWVQGLQEQGWAQLLIEDEAGAIGNMHSLQSPYFEAVYKPESYVIRSIGYLNLCHYGDAYKTLTVLEKKYSPWHKEMRSYIKRNKKTSIYYSTVSKYLKSKKSATNMHKLPYQVIREMARHRDYLNVQDAINKLVDEKEQYNFLVSIINKDRRNVRWKMKKSKKRQRALERKIKLSTKDKRILKELNQLKQKRLFEKDLQKFYSFQLKTFKKSKRGLRKFEKAGKQYVEVRKHRLRKLAGELLRDRLVEMTTKLSEILKNNEFLRYEVFAGSGENLRYLAAGGKTGKNRVPASAVPKSKDLKWTFDGEFWADEVGHYRSGLKSNCPQNTVKRE